MGMVWKRWGAFSLAGERSGENNVILQIIYTVISLRQTSHPCILKCQYVSVSSFA